MKRLILALGLTAACATSDPPQPPRPVTAPPPTGSRMADLSAPKSVSPDLESVRPPIEELTLAGALDLALADHPRLGLVRARLAVVEARAGYAGRLSDPTLVVGSETARFEGESFGQAELLLGLTQSIPLGGRRGEARELAEQQVDVAASEARAVLYEVRREVRGVFASALFAGTVVGLFAELEAIRADELALAERRSTIGDATRKDVLAAELRGAEARRALSRARDLDERARIELAAALGSPEREVRSVNGELEAAVTVPELAQLVERMEREPALLGALARTAEARARSRLADAERIPDLRVDLLYRHFLEDDEGGVDAILGMPLPIFDGGRGRADATRREIATAEFEAARVRSKVEHELRATHARVRAALDELAFFEAEVIPRERELLELAEVRHTIGDLSEGDLLEARAAWVAVRLRRAGVQRDLLEALAGSVLFDPEL